MQNFNKNNILDLKLFLDKQFFFIKNCYPKDDISIFIKKIFTYFNKSLIKLHHVSK